jgi:hypothetical protein
MHGNLSRRFDTDLDLVAVHGHYDDPDVVADHDRLVEFAAEN